MAESRVVLEASTPSEWVARHLESLGLEVIGADPNFAPMYATRSKKVKTDKRDARCLAQAARLGAYKPAHRMSDEQREVRTRIEVRRTLVQMQTRMINQSDKPPAKPVASFASRNRSKRFCYWRRSRAASLAT